MRLVISSFNLAGALLLWCYVSGMVYTDAQSFSTWIYATVYLVVSLLWFDAEYFLAFAPNSPRVIRRYRQRVAQWKEEQKVRRIERGRRKPRTKT